MIQEHFLGVLAQAVSTTSPWTRRSIDSLAATDAVDLPSDLRSCLIMAATEGGFSLREL